MASAFGAKALPKHLRTATRHDEWDDVEVPAFVTPSFYKPPPPPLPKEKPAKPLTKSQRAMAKARAANMGVAYGKPRKKVKKAPVVASPPRTVNTPVKSVTLEASSPAKSAVSFNSSALKSQAVTRGTLPVSVHEDIVFGCPEELRKGYYLKEDGWFPRGLLYRDWARLTPLDGGSIDLSDRCLNDGDLALLGQLQLSVDQRRKSLSDRSGGGYVQSLCLKKNTNISYKGIEAWPALSNSRHSTCRTVPCFVIARVNIYDGIRSL